MNRRVIPKREMSDWHIKKRREKAMMHKMVKEVGVRKLGRTMENMERGHIMVKNNHEIIKKIESMPEIRGLENIHGGSWTVRNIRKTITVIGILRLCHSLIGRKCMIN